MRCHVLRLYVTAAAVGLLRRRAGAGTAKPEQSRTVMRAPWMARMTGVRTLTNGVGARELEPLASAV
jgi:hypothetical protein